MTMVLFAMPRSSIAWSRLPTWPSCSSMPSMYSLRPLRPLYSGRSGLSEYIDGMLEHDGHVGNLLQAIDDLGIANNTIVIYGTDNGPHMNSWPDGAMTPFRSEKNTNWEGAYRVPAMIRWPGRIKAG